MTNNDNSNNYTIQASTVDANLSGLLTLLINTGKTEFLESIQQNIHVLEPDEQDRLPLKLVTENINTISEIINEKNLGLKIVNLIDLSKIHLYSTIKYATGNIYKEGKVVPLPILLNLITRYFFVITEVVSLTIDEYNDYIRINLKPNMPDIISMHQTEGVVVGIYRMLKAFYPIKFIDIQLMHSQPENTDKLYESCLGVIPQFDKPSNFMVLSTDSKIGDIDFQLTSLFSNLQNIMDKEFPNSSYHNRCRHILKCILGFGEPTREHVANILNMSISSLQRRLKQEGFSFQEILLETRKELTIKLLVEQKRSTTDVAFLLGYQSSSQFFKAFKQWFKMKPSELQQCKGKV